MHDRCTGEAMTYLMYVLPRGVSQAIASLLATLGPFMCQHSDGRTVSGEPFIDHCFISTLWEWLKYSTMSYLHHRLSVMIIILIFYTMGDAILCAII